MPVQLPLAGNWNNNAFRTYSACDARNPTPADCNDEPAYGAGPLTCRSTRHAGRLLEDAINGGGTALHLVPIFNGITTGEYDVVGFAVGDVRERELRGSAGDRGRHVPPPVSSTAGHCRRAAQTGCSTGFRRQGHRTPQA
jgi:hypothetical protein